MKDSNVRDTVIKFFQDNNIEYMENYRPPIEIEIECLACYYDSYIQLFLDMQDVLEETNLTDELEGMFIDESGEKSIVYFPMM